jgi:hypothetical protein
MEMTMNFADYKDKLDEFVNKGTAEFEAFLEYWRDKNPEPVKRTAQFSILFWLAVVAATSAATVSGFRIFDRFYQVAFVTSGNVTFSTLEALFGIGAVNVTLIALSFGFAYQKRKHNQSSLIVGLCVAVAISFIAGLGQSFQGLGMKDIVSGFDWILAVALAFVTALEYLSGDLAGVEYVRYEDEKLVCEREYRDEHKKWLAAAKGQFGLFMANFKKFSEQDTGSREVSEQPSRSRQVSVNKEDIIAVLEKHYEQNKMYLGVSDVTRELACSLYKLDMNNLTDEDEQKVRAFTQSKKGNVSQVRNNWIAEKENI